MRKTFPGRMSWTAYKFYRFKQNRNSFISNSLTSIRCPSQKNKVSIVLPVYNGDRYLREALNSILEQTYNNFELIIVNDGSTDDSPQIIEEFIQNDSRIHVIHQENHGLPAALSNGFRVAKGEFLTWISADNRQKTDFLSEMISCLQRHPDWDMAYANIDIIDEDGTPLKESDWYLHYQNPPGSEHISLPSDTSELNTYANNYVASAFMYRDRVDHLLGDYSPWRLGTEDYDYWMRVNALLKLHHVDFSEPVYEYRFHPDSLTSRDEELGITRNRIRLMIFEDFRRDFYLAPMIWEIQPSKDNMSQNLAEQISQWASSADHIFCEYFKLHNEETPKLWFPAVYLKLSDNPIADHSPPSDWPEQAWKVLVVNRDHTLPEVMSPKWNVCISTSTQSQPTKLSNPRQGWLSIPTVEALCSAIDIQVRAFNTAKLEAIIENYSVESLKISVVICTYQRGDLLMNSMRSIAQQTFPPDHYELIIVNNDPNDQSIKRMTEELRDSDFKHHPDHIKLIQCPFKGLSYARNSGLSESSGHVVCFIDDDAEAKPDLLEKIWQTYEKYPQAGVIGGSIKLEIPQPRPRWLKPGWEKYWSHFVPEDSQSTPVDKWWKFPWGANWSARRRALFEIGGFRGQYGRHGSDFNGGEELVATLLIQRLGYEIIVTPEAMVQHYPEPERFTLKHVWKTIQTGKRIEYRQKADLYLPTGLSLRWFMRNLIVYPAKAAFESGKSTHQRFEDLMYAWAYFRLTGQLVRDYLKMLRVT